MFRFVICFSVMALLGVAAIAGHQYWTLHHAEQASDVVDGEPLSVADPDVEPKEVLKSLNKATSELIAWSNNEKSDAAAKQVQELLTRVVEGHVELQALGEDDQHFQQSRWNMLYATYAATTVDPAMHRGAFDEMTSQLLSNEPNSELAANAALLRVLVQHNLERPVTRDLFVDLDKFTSAYPPALGIKLFELIARDLMRSGQSDSAKIVLQYGVKTYQGTSAATTLSGMLAKVEPPSTQRSGGNSQWTVRWGPAVYSVPRNLQSKVNASKQKCTPTRRRR